MKNTLVVIIAVSFILVSCKKEISSIGSDILPFAEINYTKKNIDVSFIKIDSIETENVLTGLLGVLNDDITGRIKCESFTSWGFTGTNADFGSNSKFLEAKLNLYFATRYGDVTQPLKITVYEITENWDDNKTYTSKDSLAYDPTPIAIDTITFASDSSFLSNVSVVTLKLSDAFGQKIFNTDPTNLTDAIAFKNFFKGFFITAELINPNNPPGIVYSIIYTSSKTTLDIVYETAAGDTNTFSFLVRNKYDKFFTKVSRTLTGNELLAQHNNDSLYVFIQPMALIWGKLTLPDRNDTLFSTEKAINKAIIELYADPNYTTSEMNLNPPPAIYVRKFSTDSTGNITVDRNATISTTYFNETDKIYYIDITTTLQQYIKDTTVPNSYILEPIARNYSLNRVILGGTKHPKLYPVIKIFYSKLE